LRKRRNMVSESDFILDGINHGLLSTVRGTLQI
jgi:hypothetical protein